MEFYLRWLDKHERAAGEESPIGLILCAAADEEQVELFELGKKAIRVSEYMTELPPMGLLQKRLHLAKEVIALGQTYFAIQTRRHLSRNGGRPPWADRSSC